MASAPAAMTREYYNGANGTGNSDSVRSGEGLRANNGDIYADLQFTKPDVLQPSILPLPSRGRAHI